jgi:hypothetical protein
VTAASFGHIHEHEDDQSSQANQAGLGLEREHREDQAQHRSDEEGKLDAGTHPASSSPKVAGAQQPSNTHTARRQPAVVASP